MKSLTIHTLAVAVVLALGTPSLAVSGELSGLPVSQSEKGTISAPAATSAGPFYALSGLDTQSLAEQEMTDQELKAVEGGEIWIVIIDIGLASIHVGEHHDGTTYCHVFF